MALAIHKLTAGSGYTYLTRQVAIQDATERGHSSLASYYTEKGETPGRWVGSGLTGLDGLTAGDVVTEAHMLNLFGAGYHPLAEQLRAQAAAAGQDARGQARAGWLGTPFRVYADDVTSFRMEVARRVAELNVIRGLDANSPVSVEDRARMRTEVAVERFREEHERDPADARELSATIARLSRPRTTAVAGYDLTFSPVKSVSALWALANQPVAAAIERALDAAIADALAFLERTALFTREGTDGVRQVETRGLVAVAFTHRDSRAGDPDLHTHVAVANKVQAKQSGKWLAVDGRPLYKALTAASEVYTTALQARLRESLDVRFVDVPNRDPRKRPTREIAGVNPELAARWSTRRADITARTGELAKAFQADHGRPPTPVEAIKLAQQATLETRDAKHPARSLTEQRDSWAEQAREVLGSDHAIRAMVTASLSPTREHGPRVDTAWIQATAARIGHTLGTHRAVWQQVHVYAEAQRQVRRTDLPLVDQQRVAGLLVDEVLTGHSVVLARPGQDTVTNLPEELRRSDGTSVYTPVGSTLYTSREVLAAEARLVAHAGECDGARAPAAAVQDALEQSAEAGQPLNSGQDTLVREMATSGARLQLAIAPAGAGKTTALRALTHAWTTAGGTVLGLAPSAAAADVLGQHIDASTDTLAKLAWHLTHPALGETPAWVTAIGPSTLVLVDEAGMADTLTLDAVTDHVISRGGSVRLIGDDQQLAAIGAGGVLRDIQAAHGSLHLTELMRFSNPAEGSASLALRDGAPEAIGFYLDADRVHVGDLTTLTDDVFTAWASDRTRGVDAVMLAPTKDLVAELNQRARTHRLTTSEQPPSAAMVMLADGLAASVGDVVITRANDRRLPVSASDFVKNGDRWTITALPGGGNVTVTGLRHRRTVTLPAEYVAAHLTLGYASTIHTAQGVTADRSHTLLTGGESRQLVYTAATRGRDSNHLYLDIVGDPDSHALIRPETTHPRTATDILESILARDDSARSATTTAADHTDPAVLLGEAVARYRDTLHHAAEDLLGEANLTRLDAGAERLHPGLTDAPAWPTLRTHLVLLAAHGHHPLHELQDAITRRPLGTAHDPAAVIDWRLPQHTPNYRSDMPGPLPWLPALPAALLEHSTWGAHLVARAGHVRARATILTNHTLQADTPTPEWARHGHARPDPQLLAEVEVWRAGTGVDPTDRRPTGPTQHQPLLRTYQDRLNRRLAAGSSPALDEWAPTLNRLLPDQHRADPFTPLLAERLAAISRAGLDTPALLDQALARGPLPDDHAAAALWWRISAHLSPAVAATTTYDHPLSSTWTDTLPDLVGAHTTAELRGSPWWGALVTVIDHALARGHSLDALFSRVPGPEQDLDPCQGLVWRLTSLTTPPPDHHGHHSAATAEEMDLILEPVATAPTDAEVAALPFLDEPAIDDTPDAPTDPHEAQELGEPDQVEAAIALARLVREHAEPLPPSEAMIQAQVSRAIEADTSPVTPERIAALNELAADYYGRAFTGSWAQAYLAERLAGTDLTSHPHVRPGYAPAGWTSLVDHLGGYGATNDELLAAGLAATTRDGRLIDRFRDRLILPITRTSSAGVGADTGESVVLGFVARRHPKHTETTGGPKYLNTPDTVLFHKGAQLYTAGVHAALLGDGAVPVLVEGPLDALAITTATDGCHVGLAPLGTALTEEQAHQLATLSQTAGAAPVVAADADTAGHQAAERTYWLLTQHGLTPASVQWQAGSDPAETLARSGPHALRVTLETSAPLSQQLLDSRLRSEVGLERLRRSVAVVAAGSPDRWDTDIQHIADTINLPLPVVRRELATALHERAHDPRAVTQAQTRTRPTPPVPGPPPARAPHRAATPEQLPTASAPPRTTGPSR